MDIIENIWSFLAALTLLIIAISWIWIAVRAFQHHFIWGLAIVAVPLAPLAFAILHWDRARRPMLLGLIAGAAFFVEMVITSGYKALFG